MDAHDMRISIDGLDVHCQIDGSQGPWLVFSHSLGCDLRMWDAQAAHFGRDFRVLRYDIRGHGHSPAGAQPFDLTALAGDLLGLLTQLEIEQAHVVGISLGGLIAQTFALDHSARVRSLTLADTTSRYTEAGRTMWHERARTVMQDGMAPLCEPTLQRWFTPRFLAEQPAEAGLARAMILQTSPAGYAGCCAALAAADTQARLATIACPTLVLVGEHDQGTPLAMSQQLHAGIDGSALHVLPEAAHLASFEQPAAFNRRLEEFLAPSAP